MKQLVVAFVVFGAMAAQAQQTSAPPIVPADQPPPPQQQFQQLPPLQQQPVRQCASNHECEAGDVCVGFQEIAPGQWTRGTCTPGAAKRARMDQGTQRSLACRTDADCYNGEHCGDYQPLGNGQFGPGSCQLGARGAPPPAYAPAPVSGRFAYTGQVPPGYRLVQEPNMKLIIPGVIVAGVSYFLNVIWAAAELTGFPLIPLVGPFIEVARRPRFDNSAFTFALITTVGEAIGATLITLGIVFPRQWLERDLRAPSVTLVPMLGPGGTTGASVVGRF